MREYKFLGGITLKTQFADAFHPFDIWRFLEDIGETIVSFFADSLPGRIIAGLFVLAVFFGVGTFGFFADPSTTAGAFFGMGDSFKDMPWPWFHWLLLCIAWDFIELCIAVVIGLIGGAIYGLIRLFYWIINGK